MRYDRGPADSLAGAHAGSHPERLGALPGEVSVREGGTTSVESWLDTGEG